MPTGYTAAVKDDISFEQFVWSCARGMGALIMMRDEPTGAPIPERFEPSQYYAMAADKARAELARLETMSIEQVEAEADAAYVAAVQSYRDRIREALELRNKYSAMLAKVVQWEPPTAEHKGLQEFMASQLRQSIDFDCSTSYGEKPYRQDATAWHNGLIAKARKDILYYEAEQAKEVERTEGRNEWIAALRKSVPPFDAQPEASHG